MQLFQQGAFQIAPGTTPEQLAKKREAIQKYNYGHARYTGAGLADMFRGMLEGVQENRINEYEAEQSDEANKLFEILMGGSGGSDPIVASSSPGWNPFSPPDAAPVAQEAAQAAPSGNFPASLIQTESSGRWDALNNEVGAGGARGHGGRLQFGAARLKDAANAGIVPVMSPQEFSRQSPEVQTAVENWHFADIDREAEKRGLGRFIGQNVAGIPITQDGIRAMAHLGGIKGAERFLKSGGEYNPSDVYGTSLADYARTHGGGSASPVVATQSSPGYAPLPAYNGPSVAELSAAMANPWMTPTQKQQIGVMLAEAQAASDPMRALQYQAAQQQFAMNQAKLDQMRNPPAPGPQSAAGKFYADRASGLIPDGVDFKGGGVTVNNNMGGAPKLGKLSTDYGYVLDPETGQAVIDPATGLPTAAPVPGSKEAQAIEAAGVQATERDVARENAADVVTSAAQRARDAAGDRDVTGLFGKVAAFNPYSDNAEVYRQVDVLKSIASAEALNAMRRQSPTGGALGSVTEKELKLLSEQAGALDPASPNFLRDLNDYEQAILRTIHGPGYQAEKPALDFDPSNMSAEQVQDFMAQNPVGEMPEEMRNALIARLRAIQGSSK